MHLSDRVTGGFLVLLGAFAFWAGSRLPAVPGQDVGPAVFPMVIGGGLMLCGALIVLGVGRSFEEPDPEPTEAHAGLARWLGKRRVLAALVPPALLLFYVLAADTLGFLLTGFAMVLIAALSLGATLRLAVAMAIAAPPVIHLVFYKLLRVPLPEGLLAAPWA
ncbi:tripartite tricarboxylate transporter TctB family protein [Roseomonas terrae]|jgi:putative tricarboxylic transport membrane protein|uniref:Tripartite tricarboxylate transporter TctB family protein n=1 Tax=Neoroseomonas terrae TaxID=424799 RepID=A0ABS5EBV3_9PROT|nr:tripartite tricarboxylate transporter TctB family protein [Neoroseomonas terrae]MBR0648503.1 tripartite tricarboxylate transporter TctB family protein [Neoroseomonas terrae]